MNDIFEELIKIRKQGLNVALCTVVNVKGSAPRSSGAKMLVYDDGKILGSVGGGDLERKVIENALKVIQKKKAELYKHDLLHQHGMCCGGVMEIFIEPILKKNKLYIFGSGHTGRALAEFSTKLDFEIALIDDRINELELCLADNINKIHLQHTSALNILPFDENTYIVILTYNHQIDREILAYCIQKKFAYLGMIGSIRKVEMTKKIFKEGGLSDDSMLEKIQMPIGLDIGAETPEEIAISILAEIIKVKNKVTV